MPFFLKVPKNKTGAIILLFFVIIFLGFGGFIFFIAIDTPGAGVYILFGGILMLFGFIDLIQFVLLNMELTGPETKLIPENKKVAILLLIFVIIFLVFGGFIFFIVIDMPGARVYTILSGISMFIGFINLLLFIRSAIILTKLETIHVALIIYIFSIIIPIILLFGVNELIFQFYPIFGNPQNGVLITLIILLCFYLPTIISYSLAILAKKTGLFGIGFLLGIITWSLILFIGIHFIATARIGDLFFPVYLSYSLVLGQEDPSMKDFFILILYIFSPPPSWIMVISVLDLLISIICFLIAFAIICQKDKFTEKESMI